jgi:hypothetical protein
VVFAVSTLVRSTRRRRAWPCPADRLALAGSDRSPARRRARQRARRRQAVEARPPASSPGSLFRRPITDAPEAAQAVGIGRRGTLVANLALTSEQAHVDLSATQIQSSVQHEDWPPPTRFSVTR